MSFFPIPRRYPRLTFSLFACSTAGLQAQNSAAPPEPTQLAPVVVQGRDTDLVGVASSASQGIVGALELEARPFLRRGELLEVIPGVVITQHSGNGKANQYFLRGFNLDHGTDFSLSVDGMPVNLRSHAHGQGYADLNFLIPEIVEQVDYNKGPFYAEVGDFSAAGAAQFRQVQRIAAPFVTLSLGENQFTRLTAGGSRAQGAGTLTGALELSHDDGPWQLRENGRRFNGFLRRAWSGPAADYRLTAMIYHGEWRSSDQIPSRAVESNLLDRFGHVDPSNGGKSERASISFEAALKDAASTRLNAYAILYRLNLFSNFTYFLDDPENGDQFNQRDRRWVIGGAAQRTWAHPGSAVQSETTLGIQARVDFIGELGLHRTRRRTRIAAVRDDRADEASAGVFAQNETRWTDWLRSSAGLRFDGYHFKVESDIAENSGSRLADIASPKLTIALGPWHKTELYANTGFGFHSNDARGTTIRVDPADRTTPIDRVTPLARSRGAEIGLRTGVVPGLVTTASWWALDLDSELVFVGDAGGTEPTGRTRRYGIEIANYLRVNPWLAVDADVAFTTARYRDDTGAGKRIANSISSVVTGGLTFGLRQGWFGSTRLRYYGPQPLVEDNSVRAPSSLTYKANLGWRSPHWQLAIEILNLFDRENHDIAYHYASRLPGEADPVDDVHFHPAEPRTVRVSVTRRF
jgi:hypothetical protein